MTDTFSKKYLDESIELIHKLDASAIEAMAQGLGAVRDGGGRLFILGVGGSAGHASHAVNDFRKICGFEAYTPTDNVSELTARVNDEGWDTSFSEWLRDAAERKFRDTVPDGGASWFAPDDFTPAAQASRGETVGE